MSNHVELSPVTEELRQHRFPDPILVSRPTMPDLEEYQEKLEQIWQTRWLTNNSLNHQELEESLANYLGVPHLSLFCNGTIALLVALQALRINDGEVITTPFTFPATPHALFWNRVRPVFCDIEDNTYNLDPVKAERLITADTRAIMPVHVYGSPCNVEAFQELSETHGLPIIYDAAHTFGVWYKGRSLLEWGDMSVLSFHATKLYSTLEGGAIVAQTAAQKTRIDHLRNFGIAGEEQVVGPGINGKMNEFQAAYGLLHLDLVDAEIANRAQITRAYQEGLGTLPGIRLLPTLPDVKSNHAYFPILVDPARFGMSRDALYDHLKELNVYTRKYFHPLCSHYSCYQALPSARSENLPVAERVAKQVLCLPLYGSLGVETAQTICMMIEALHYMAAEGRLEIS